MYHVGKVFVIEHVAKNNHIPVIVTAANQIVFARLHGDVVEGSVHLYGLYGYCMKDKAENNIP